MTNAMITRACGAHHTDGAHYEAAFEDALRAAGWPYVRVDDQKRSILAGTTIKSFDFLVHPPGGGGWLVDVKGRKFPYSSRGLQPAPMPTAASRDLSESGNDFPLSPGRSTTTHLWENWVTDDDLAGMAAWERTFNNPVAGGNPGSNPGSNSGGSPGCSPRGHFEGRFVFAYWLTRTSPAAPLGPIHLYRGRAYAFLSVSASVYAQKSRRRSPRWQTRFMSASAFRQEAVPVFDVPTKPLPAVI